MWCWCVESCLGMKFYIQEFKFNIKKLIFQAILWYFLDWHILWVGIVTVKKVVQWDLTEFDAIIIISWPYYNWAAWVSKSLKFVPSNCLIDFLYYNPSWLDCVRWCATYISVTQVVFFDSKSINILI